MISKVLFVLIAFNGVATILASNRRFNVEFYKLTCEQNSTALEKLECDFTKIAPNRFIFTLNFMFNREWGSGAEAHILIHLKAQNGTKLFKFTEFREDICVILSKTVKHLLIRYIMNEVRRTSNLPYSCPLKANVLYSFGNFSITDATVPPYAPITDFTLAVSFYENQKLTSKVLLEGATVPRL